MMATNFQQINRTVQDAVKSAKMVCAEQDLDDLMGIVDGSSSTEGYWEVAINTSGLFPDDFINVTEKVYRDLWEDVFKSSITAYVSYMALSDEDEEEEED